MCRGHFTWNTRCLQLGMMISLDLFRSELQCDWPISHSFIICLIFALLLASISAQESRFEALFCGFWWISWRCWRVLRWNSFLLLLLFSGFQSTRYRLQSDLYIVEHHIKLSLLVLFFYRILSVDWRSAHLILLGFIQSVVCLLIGHLDCWSDIFILTGWLTFHIIHKDDLS